MDEIRLEALASLEQSDDEETDEIYQEHVFATSYNPISNNEQQNTEIKLNIECVKKEFPEEIFSKKRKIQKNSISIIDENIEIVKEEVTKKISSKIRDENFSNLENVTSPDSSSLQNCNENEFVIFGKFIAMQLQSMPLENALELESQIHKLITETRLKIHRLKLEERN